MTNTEKKRRPLRPEWTPRKAALSKLYAQLQRRELTLDEYLAAADAVRGEHPE